MPCVVATGQPLHAPLLIQHVGQLQHCVKVAHSHTLHPYAISPEFLMYSLPLEAVNT
jgi:hypothetical protein